MVVAVSGELAESGHTVAHVDILEACLSRKATVGGGVGVLHSGEGGAAQHIACTTTHVGHFLPLLKRCDGLFAAFYLSRDVTSPSFKN